MNERAEESRNKLISGVDISAHGKGIKQGMVDGSASKPALRQDSSYMVEKT